MGDRGAEDRELAVVEFCDVIRLEAPFDFGIAGQSACAGARDVGQDEIKGLRDRETTDIGDLRLNPCICRKSLLHLTGAMGVDLDSCDGGFGIQVGDGKRLATGGSAAIQDLLVTRTSQSGDQLRGFILNDCVGAAKGLGLRDVAGVDAAG